jgi:predicted GH43/DUF377 family glycosyl hydrolase
MPVVEAESVKFIYATSLDGDVGSTVVFNLVEEDGLHIVRPPEGATFGHGRLRGGSQAVRVDEGWLVIVHDVSFSGSSRTYLHRFVMFDDKLTLVSMSDPFYFEKSGIEFCAGLAQLGGKLVASYAINDGSARFGIFDLNRVRKKLRKDFVI